MAAFKGVWACVLSASLAPASGINIVNRHSGKCLDLFAPCVDGSTDEECDRTPAKDLSMGTNLQLYHCNGKKNQEFEFLSNGRIRNPFTNMCIDILAPCKDHFRDPCERVSVGELQGEANIQLYTCHKDSGILSNSYGNQKWNFQNGQLTNTFAKLCLAPIQTEGDMANIRAETCADKGHQTFDFLESAAVHSASASAYSQKFQLLSDMFASGDEGQSHESPFLAAVPVGLLAVGAIVGVRSRSTHQHIAVEVE